MLSKEQHHQQPCATSSKVIVVKLVFITRAARHTEALAVANQFHAVLVHPDQTDRVYVGENAAIKSTGSHLSKTE